MEACMRICAIFSTHIAQAEQRTRASIASDGGIPSMPESDAIDEDDLQDCKDNLSHLSNREARREEELFNTLAERMAATNDPRETAGSIAQIRDEWMLARKSMVALTTALRYLEQHAGVVENFATGDAVQFMVSTQGKVLHGRNRGLGWRARQVGGYMEDETVRELSRNFNSLAFQDVGAWQKSQRGPHEPNFKDRFGGGFKLTTARTKHS